MSHFCREIMPYNVLVVLNCDMGDYKPRLLDQMRQRIRLGNYSIRTEATYASG